MTQAQHDAYIEGRHLTAEQSMAGAGVPTSALMLFAWTWMAETFASGWRLAVIVELDSAGR